MLGVPARHVDQLEILGLPPGRATVGDKVRIIRYDSVGSDMQAAERGRNGYRRAIPTDLVGTIVEDRVKENCGGYCYTVDFPDGKIL